MQTHCKISKCSNIFKIFENTLKKNEDTCEFLGKKNLLVANMVKTSNGFSVRYQYQREKKVADSDPETTAGDLKGKLRSSRRNYE